MHLDSWERTLLDEQHSQLQKQVRLLPDEFPIVSFYASDEDWTLYTTHRLTGKAEGVKVELEHTQFEDTDFGDFEGDSDSPRIDRALIKNRGKKYYFVYETGFASMAPIHYFKFWSLKWPVWKKTYEINQAEQTL